MLLKLFKSPIFLLVFLIFVISLLVFLAYQQAWQYHLAVDIWGFYFPRFQYFTNNLSFEAYKGNEYLPGAMLFFLIPGIVFTFLSFSWQNYLIGLFSINILLILTQVAILRKYNVFAPLVFLALILFAGPIVLYRHELFVSFFLILSTLLAKNLKITWASFLLGIATMIKIFPAFVLPYFLIYFFLKKGKYAVLQSITLFILGAITVASFYLVFGSIAEIKSALFINSIKPLHAESVWASFLELYFKIFQSHWIPGLGANGIFGINPEFIILPIPFYNYFWIIPQTLFYFAIFEFTKKDKHQNFEPLFVFLPILLFIIFSKIITPQYLLWAFLTFPLILVTKSEKKLLASLALISITLLLTQYIYPLKYSELLGIFFSSGQRADLFYALLLRNELLILIFILCFAAAFKKNNENS